MRTAGPHLLGDGGEGSLDQVRIPGARQSDRLREAGRLRPHEPVQCFVVKNHRNAQPGVLLDPLLDRVGIVCLGTGTMAVTRPLDAPDSHSEPFGRFSRVEPPIGIGELPLGVPHAQHLCNLLLQRHAFQEVIHTLRRGQRGVLVIRPLR